MLPSDHPMTTSWQLTAFTASWQVGGLRGMGGRIYGACASGWVCIAAALSRVGAALGWQYCVVRGASLSRGAMQQAGSLRAACLWQSAGSLPVAVSACSHRRYCERTKTAWEATCCNEEGARTPPPLRPSLHARRHLPAVPSFLATVLHMSDTKTHVVRWALPAWLAGGAGRIGRGAGGQAGNRGPWLAESRYVYCSALQLKKSHAFLARA